MTNAKISMFTMTKYSNLRQLSFIDLERGGFGEILPEVMILPDSPERRVYK